MLFQNEVSNIEELIKNLNMKDLPNYKTKVAVVCFLFDKDGNLILQKRGPQARDENGKIEAIGGSINDADVDFITSLKRELVEEAGSEANIQIDGFIGAMLDTKMDKSVNEMFNWIILAYRGSLISGNLINMEPSRCLCFEKRKITEYQKEELSATAYTVIEYLKNN